MVAYIHSDTMCCRAHKATESYNLPNSFRYWIGIHWIGIPDSTDDFGPNSDSFDQNLTKEGILEQRKKIKFLAEIWNIGIRYVSM